MSVLTGLMTLLAHGAAVLGADHAGRGAAAQRLSLALFTELPPAAGMAGGGFGNAIAGHAGDGRHRRR